MDTEAETRESANKGLVKTHNYALQSNSDEFCNMG